MIKRIKLKNINIKVFSADGMLNSSLALETKAEYDP